MFCCIAAHPNTFAGAVTGATGGGVTGTFCFSVNPTGGTVDVVDDAPCCDHVTLSPARAFAVHIAPLPDGRTIVFPEATPPVFRESALSLFLFLVAAKSIAICFLLFIKI